MTETLYAVAGLSLLLLLPLGLIGSAVYDIGKALASGGPGLAWAVLQAVGFVIIAMAVLDVTKYLIEEEVFRDRELGTPSEARQAPAKLLTMIIIALNLEALVLVFEQGKESPRLMVHPVPLLLAAVIGVVGLGTYPWLTNRIGRERPRATGGSSGEGDDARAGGTGRGPGYSAAAMAPIPMPAAAAVASSPDSGATAASAWTTRAS